MSAVILAETERMEGEARMLYASLYDGPPVGTRDEHQWRYDTLDRIEELREHAASIKARIKSSFEHIRNYYGLDLRVGLAVKHADRPGRIVSLSGQYVEVLLESDEESMPCHATSEMGYPPGARVGPGPDERFTHLVETAELRAS
ncbi:hypothetical protein ACWEQO_33675 [Streptomyces sp. NPDC004051]